MSQPKPLSNPKLAAALAHARHGRAVLPVYWSTSGRCACGRADCHSPAKHPIPDLVPRGVRQATTSRVVIRAWWAHAPLANPILATTVKVEDLRHHTLLCGA